MKDVNIYPPGQFTPLSCCKQAHATFSFGREEVGSIFWPLLLSGVLNSAADCWTPCGPEYVDGGVETAALLVLGEGGVGEGVGGGGNRQQRGGKSRSRHCWKPDIKKFNVSKWLMAKNILLQAVLWNRNRNRNRNRRNRKFLTSGTGTVTGTVTC
jgi:hypothetical protein